MEVQKLGNHLYSKEQNNMHLLPKLWKKARQAIQLDNSNQNNNLKNYIRNRSFSRVENLLEIQKPILSLDHGLASQHPKPLSIQATQCQNEEQIIQHQQKIWNNQSLPLTPRSIQRAQEKSMMLNYQEIKVQKQIIRSKQQQILIRQNGNQKNKKVKQQNLVDLNIDNEIKQQINKNSGKHDNYIRSWRNGAEMDCQPPIALLAQHSKLKKLQQISSNIQSQSQQSSQPSSLQPQQAGLPQQQQQQQCQQQMQQQPFSQGQTLCYPEYDGSQAVRIISSVPPNITNQLHSIHSQQPQVQNDYREMEDEEVSGKDEKEDVEEDYIKQDDKNKNCLQVTDYLNKINRQSGTRCDGAYKCNLDLKRQNDFPKRKFSLRSKTPKTSQNLLHQIGEKSVVNTKKPIDLLNIKGFSYSQWQNESQCQQKPSRGSIFRTRSKSQQNSYCLQENLPQKQNSSIQQISKDKENSMSIYQSLQEYDKELQKQIIQSNTNNICLQLKLDDFSLCQLKEQQEKNNKSKTKNNIKFLR